MRFCLKRLRCRAGVLPVLYNIRGSHFSSARYAHAHNILRPHISSAEGLHFSAFILFSNSVCIFTENPSISSSMSSGIDSSIISSRLANSVLLVYWLIACGPVFVQFRQLHPSPQAFPFALHPHWRVWHHPHPLPPVLALHPCC